MGSFGDLQQDVDRLLRQLRPTADLTTEKIDSLRARLFALSDTAFGAPLPTQALHGDASLDNLLCAAESERFVWNDFEDTLRGPVHWDVAGYLISLEARGADPAFLARALDAYGWDDKRELAPFTAAHNVYDELAVVQRPTPLAFIGRFVESPHAELGWPRRAIEAGRDMETQHSTSRLALLLAAAMFVFVIDTSLMNVSISAVVDDLDTTVSGVQSAIAIEALVSAAFILIGSKVGDLFGRKRAYMAGLLLYVSGALSMVFAQSLAPIIIFWAVIGGLGASLYMPAMQSLIHGNFEGTAQAKAYALVGASAAIAAAIGPLLGGFLTTYLSWRVGFMLEAVVIAVVLSAAGGPPRCALHRRARCRCRRLGPLGARHGGLVLGILAWQEGGESVGALLALGLAAMALLVYWLLRKTRGQAGSARPPPVQVQAVQLRDLPGHPPAGRPGRDADRPADLPPAGSRLQRDAGGPLARPALADHVRGRPDRRQTRREASPRRLIRAGFALLLVGVAVLIPLVPSADTGWYLVVPLMLAGAGLGLLVSQLNNYTLSPISEERIGEAAGINSATGSFGLSLGLAFAGAIMLATLSIAFTDKAESSQVLTPAEQTRVADALEDDAQVMSDAQLNELLVGQPADARKEIVQINDDARPLALQVALASLSWPR